MNLGQFDVYVNPSKRGLAERPYVVVVQCNYLDTMPVRVVVPLVVESALRPIHRLNPIFKIEAKRLYFHPLEIAVFPTRSLRTRVANLEEYRDRIIAALDFVFTGI